MSLLKANDLLDSLISESKQEHKEIKLEKDPKLESMIDIWESAMHFEPTQIMRFYNYLDTNLNSDYSQEDITKLLTVLPGYKAIDGFNYKSGLFISALINHSAENNITLNLVGSLQSLLFLAYNNCKRHITISGDVGPYAGCLMESGMLRIIGNADFYLGFDLNGGIISVEGNSRYGVGEHQSGGEISLYGKYESLGYIYGGSVYHYGRLIHKDGRMIKW